MNFLAEVFNIIVTLKIQVLYIKWLNIYTLASSKAPGGSSILGKAYIAPRTLRQLTPGMPLNLL